MRGAGMLLVFGVPAVALAGPPVVLIGPPAGAQAPIGDPTSRESLEKRLFLLERASGRGDCQQAIEAAALIEQDFGDVPGARLGRAHAAACEGRWLEAWNILPAARDAGFDTRALESRVRPHLRFVEILLTLDGAAITAKTESPEFVPTVRVGTTVLAPTRVAAGRYSLVVDGEEPLKVSVSPTAEHGAGAAQDVKVPPGGSTSVKIGWTTVPVGSLDVEVRVDGQSMTAGDAIDVPPPVLELPGGTSLALVNTSLGKWRADKAPSGAVRVRVPAGAGTDAAEGAGVVVTRSNTALVVDVKRVPMSTITRPATLDPAITLKLGDQVLAAGRSVRVRAGVQGVTASWSPEGGDAPYVVRWSQTFERGEGQPDLPWAHLVEDETGHALLRGLHTPGESSVVFTDARVSLPDVRGDELQVPVTGHLERTPGAVVRGRVATSSHPVYAARGARARAGRQGLAALGSGLGIAAGLAGWGTYEFGKAGSAASDARAFDAVGGQADYDALVARAESATGRANLGLGAATAATAVALGGWGYFTFRAGPDLAQAATVPLVVTQGGE